VPTVSASGETANRQRVNARGLSLSRVTLRL
jgi:hypothetical protein